VLRSRAVLAQGAYPQHPIRLVVPRSAGGVVDVVGRLWAERARPQLGNIVIENQAGGGGTIAATAVARAAPDGYTLLAGTTSALVINPVIMSQPPYVPISTEVGFPDLITQQFNGLFAPAGTPPKIIEQIAGVTRQVAAEQDFQTRLIQAGFEPVTESGPQAAANYVHAELARWTPLLK